MPVENEHAIPFLEQNIAENWEQVLSNHFPTDRGLYRKSRTSGTSYFSYRIFGPALRYELLGLQPGQVWVDIGGGDLYAQKEFFTSFRPGNESRAIVISVSNPPTRDFQQNLQFLKQEYPKKFFYLSGRRVEDIPLSELPKAKTVSDLFAALSFTEHIDRTLEHELSMLAPGGQLVARLQKAYIRDQEGHKFGIRRYLSSIEGAQLTFYGWSALVMQRTAGEIRVPPLRLTQFLSYKHAPNPKALPEKFIFCERYYVLG